MKKIFLSVVLASTLLACKKDNGNPKTPDINQDEELITTMQVFIKQGVKSTVYTFRDLDGDGGANGTVETIQLSANAEYEVVINFLNESVNPTIDLTPEISSEKKDHLICFEATGISTIVTRTDKDPNGLEVGLNSTWKTSNAGTGKLNISLKHQPDIKNGSCNIGSTDISVDFPVVIN